MKFAHYDLGHVAKGYIVEITLSGNAVNVRLLDNINFHNYSNGKEYVLSGGGLIEKSPFSLVIPRAGIWHVVIDFRGLQGQCHFSARIIPT